MKSNILKISIAIFSWILLFETTKDIQNRWDLPIFILLVMAIITIIGIIEFIDLIVKLGIKLVRITTI